METMGETVYINGYEGPIENDLETLKVPGFTILSLVMAHLFVLKRKQK
ncbi:hypothetical protein [Methanococcoides sp. NM1]|nr:hypothetical protein [Methanococcoides sp. NM1]